MTDNSDTSDTSDTDNSCMLRTRWRTVVAVVTVVKVVKIASLHQQRVFPRGDTLDDWKY